VVLHNPAVASAAGVVVVEGEEGLGHFLGMLEREKKREKRSRAGLCGVCFEWNR